MQPGEIFQHLGIALGLGLLIGLQRESAASSKLAGIRTFPLITVMGALCALLAQSFGGWIVVAGFFALTALILIGRAAELRNGVTEFGMTTEVSMLMMFGIGAYLVNGYHEVALALGAMVAVLLHFKGQLHALVQKLGQNDLTAIMQFVLISLVILPVLPNRTFGPYAVLNPRNIWLMVVLIVGISLSAYIAWKFLGERAGLVLGGILGGAISSTATTVSYARRSKQVPDSSRVAAIVILISSAVVFIRLIVLVATVAPSLFSAASVPLLSMFAVLLVSSLILWFRARDGQMQMPEQENPSELKSAIFFGAIYALVLLAVAFAKDKFGERGLFVVASLSGLTDVDAITLSTSQLVHQSRLDASTGWKLIVIAVMSNLLFKGATVALLGSKQLLRGIAGYYLAVLLTGVLFVLLR